MTAAWVPPRSGRWRRGRQCIGGPGSKRTSPCCKSGAKGSVGSGIGGGSPSIFPQAADRNVPCCSHGDHDCHRNDGVPLEHGQSRVVVDPGPHVLVAEHDGKRATQQDEAREGATLRLRLGDAPERQRRLNGRRLFWGVGLGAVTLGLVGGFVYATVRLDSIRNSLIQSPFLARKRP